MANIKSQLKRIKTNEKSHQRNKATKSALKTSIRRFREAAAAGDTAKATELAYAASRSLDKAASKGVIHKNQAANRKSAIATKAAHLEPAGKKKQLTLRPLAPAQTRNAEHGSLQCVRGVVGRTLYVGVGYRYHLERRRETSLIPATRLGAHRLELPGRHPYLSSQVCFSLPATCRNQLSKTADAGGQSAGDQHRGDTCRKRPAELLHRDASAARQGGVCHRKTGHLGPATEIAADLIDGDRTTLAI